MAEEKEEAPKEIKKPSMSNKREERFLELVERKQVGYSFVKQWDKEKKSSLIVINNVLDGLYMRVDRLFQKSNSRMVLMKRCVAGLLKDLEEQNSNLNNELS